ncbi:MAG: hypothetical protein ABIP55_04490 [Tepidisphaeraceae bacterium]
MLWTALAIVALLANCAMTSSARAGDSEFPSADELPAIAELPDPLVLRDGTRIASAQQWPARRAELLAMILHYEYGRLPPAPAPGDVRGVELISHNLRTVNATHKQFKITCTLANAPPDHNTISFVLDLLLPTMTKTDATPIAAGQKFPVILRGDWGWHKTGDDIAKLVLSRGYALAEFNRLELAPDNASRDAGLYLAYPDGDFAALAAWAWGYHRCVDFLLTRPQIDGQRIAITGHSRGGKATLLAGATDERIALTNPNGSGCWGTACFRSPAANAETMKEILRKFPFWFSPNLAQFVGREDRLPFDQHTLRACVAPRALLDTQGSQDEWSSPLDARRTHDAGMPVFALLGAAEKQAIHYRPGKHEHSVEDWTALLDFADVIFFNKPTTRPFDARPTPQRAQ